MRGVPHRAIAPAGKGASGSSTGDGAGTTAAADVDAEALALATGAEWRGLGAAERGRGGAWQAARAARVTNATMQGRRTTFDSTRVRRRFNLALTRAGAPRTLGSHATLDDRCDSAGRVRRNAAARAERCRVSCRRDRLADPVRATRAQGQLPGARSAASQSSQASVHRAARRRLQDGFCARCDRATRRAGAPGGAQKARCRVRGVDEAFARCLGQPGKEHGRNRNSGWRARPGRNGRTGHARRWGRSGRWPRIRAGKGSNRGREAASQAACQAACQAASQAASQAATWQSSARFLGQALNPSARRAEHVSSFATSGDQSPRMSARTSRQTGSPCPGPRTAPLRL